MTKVTQHILLSPLPCPCCQTPLGPSAALHPHLESSLEGDATDHHFHCPGGFLGGAAGGKMEMLNGNDRPQVTSAVVKARWGRLGLPGAAAWLPRTGHSHNLVGTSPERAMSSLHQAVPDVRLVATSTQGTTGLLSVQALDTHISYLTDKETVSEPSRGALQRTRRFCTLALWPSAQHLSFFICRQGNLMSTLLGLDKASWVGPGEQDMA